jgi:hypothetical protein
LVLLARRWFLPGVAAVAVTMVLSLACAQVATASSRQGNQWRVVATVGPVTGITRPQFLVAPSRTDAWSWWTGCTSCGGPGRTHSFVILSRWNGTRWSTIKLPPALGGVVGLGASSARNAWLFTVHLSGKHPVYKALTWAGSWRQTRIPAWTLFEEAAESYGVVPEVFGPKSVWIFNVGQPYVAVYNGRTWTKRSLPGRPTLVSAVSARDIWAVSWTTTYQQFLMHWDGTSWHSYSIPRPSHVPAHASEFIANLAAANNGVWLIREISAGSQGGQTLYLLHWDGRAWHRVSFVLPTTSVSQLAADGHGGVWLADYGRGKNAAENFDHLLSTGKWTRQRVPVTATTSDPGTESLAWVPGTHSVWATGNLIPAHSGTGVVGAIFRLNP